MSRRDDRISLSHMLDHAREAVELARGRNRADLDRDRLLNLALTRLVEVVGEASQRVSPALRSRHPEIAWRQIAGTRNVLAHGYDIVDLDILWRIVQDDLPPLAAQLRSVLDSLP